MKEIFATLNEVGYDFREQYENIELVVYSLLAFAIPFVFSQPQLLTGAVVNMFLILAAMRLRGWKVLPVVLLPSAAAFLNGMVFGPMTIFLLYLMPAIWLGNFLLVYLFKTLNIEKKINYWATLGIATIAKTALIFAGTLLLSNFGIIPAALLTAMGIMQIATALIGGVGAFALLGGYRLAVAGRKS